MPKCGLKNFFKNAKYAFQLEALPVTNQKPKTGSVKSKYKTHGGRENKSFSFVDVVFTHW
jgi:hypothetical protein